MASRAPTELWHVCSHLLDEREWNDEEERQNRIEIMKDTYGIQWQAICQGNKAVDKLANTADLSVTNILNGDEMGQFTLCDASGVPLEGATYQWIKRTLKTQAEKKKDGYKPVMFQKTGKYNS